MHKFLIWIRSTFSGNGIVQLMSFSGATELNGYITYMHLYMLPLHQPCRWALFRAKMSCFGYVTKRRGYTRGGLCREISYYDLDRFAKRVYVYLWYVSIRIKRPTQMYWGCASSDWTNHFQSSFTIGLVLSSVSPSHRSGQVFPTPLSGASRRLGSGWGRRGQRPTLLH